MPSSSSFINFSKRNSGNAKNAGILAARILGISDAAISAKVESALKDINEEAKAKGAALNARRNQKTGF